MPSCSLQCDPPASAHLSLPQGPQDLTLSKKLFPVGSAETSSFAARCVPSKVEFQCLFLLLHSVSSE